MSKISALWLAMNEIEFLPLSVASVINQVDELVLVNNRSTDGTWEWMQELASKNEKVKAINMDSIFDEKTEAASRTEALSHVNGDWVVALDADQVMSDGWLRDVQPYMGGKTECIGVRYIHNVGDIRHVHKPECNVPPYTWIIFKNTDHLRWRSASEVCAWAGPFHHASADRSCSPGSLKVCKEAAVTHLGFCKRDMMKMAVYRANRGDHGLVNEIKQARIAELRESNNPFLFCGPVERVDFGIESVPTVLKPHWLDYVLELNDAGFIQRRKHLASGEYC